VAVPATDYWFEGGYFDGVDDVGPFKRSAIYLLIFGNFDFEVNVLEFAGLDGLALYAADVDAVVD
jgi:hypothetical protein